jgi:hypothetical protein
MAIIKLVSCVVVTIGLVTAIELQSLSSPRSSYSPDHYRDRATVSFVTAIELTYQSLPRSSYLLINRSVMVPIDAVTDQSMVTLMPIDSGADRYWC